MNKIFVICPGGLVTGGPELLHQLVSTLNDNGLDSNIIYTPFDEKKSIPKAYSKYNVKVATYEKAMSSGNDIVVIPEILTGYSKYFRPSSVYIWWLSVDNYFEDSTSSALTKVKNFIKRIIGHHNHKIEISRMTEFNHLTQSYYAKSFIESHGYNSKMLSDFLNDEHLTKNVNLDDKKDIICYNPKKGVEYTNLLRYNLTNFTFVPIQDMTANQVSELLDSAKVYVDFGNHPGKDRIPREAAMASCVVITGLQGSAGNNVDIPIDNKYKIDEKSELFVEEVNSLINEVFNDFESAHEDFYDYREKIMSEKEDFRNEVMSIFNSK